MTGNTMYKFGYTEERYPEENWRVQRLHCIDADTGRARSSAKIAVDRGANLFSLIVDGVEYLMDTGPIVDGLRFLGTYVLYPSPSEVQDATFTFDGHTFTFEPNCGANFIHGLVRHEPWQFDEPIVSADSVSVTGRITFAPETVLHRFFPIVNTLEMLATLTARGIRLDFTVINNDRERRLPFGLAVHPFFRIIGPRESIRLHVPAETLMEQKKLIPTGVLLNLDGDPADLRQPVSLAGLDLDHSYRGLRPGAPQHIFYDDIGTKITLRASEFLSYSVVYCPPDMPFFCVENQSCSTDAHNLHARGFHEASGLKILDPGKSLHAWVAFEVDDQ